ncbi:MAG: hypothetical protein OQK82_06440 [Candidatus Pacearchaeota archaeon]|nr:hypothetical protein [Candidatus Pacearchaeota archaeon]
MQRILGFFSKNKSVGLITISILFLVCSVSVGWFISTKIAGFVTVFFESGSGEWVKDSPSFAFILGVVFGIIALLCGMLCSLLVEAILMLIAFAVNVFAFNDNDELCRQFPGLIIIGWVIGLVITVFRYNFPVL